MKTKLPLGVVNAVPASQIVAGTVSVERALSLPEGSLTQEQKERVISLAAAASHKPSVTYAVIKTP